MSRQLTVCLKAGDLAMLGRLRCHAAIEVCEQEGSVWLRGRDAEGELEKIFRTLPGPRFEILPDQQLLPTGKRVPRGYAPGGPWQALSEWLAVQLELAALAGDQRGREKLRIVRGGEIEEANVLRTNCRAWANYAASAPQIRLNQLAFAMNRESEVVVRGAPLPPIAGIRMVERNGICVEAGWTWRPKVDCEVIRGRLGLDHGDLAVFDRDGSWNHLRGGDFVRATRSAARLSGESRHDS